MLRTSAPLLLGLVILASLQVSVTAVNPNWQGAAICESKETLGQSEDCCTSGSITSGWPSADTGGCTKEIRRCNFSPDFKANWRCPTCYIHHLKCTGNARPAIIYYDKIVGGWKIKPGKTCNGLKGGEAVFTFITQGCPTDRCLCPLSTSDTANGESGGEPAKEAVEVPVSSESKPEL